MEIIEERHGKRSATVFAHRPVNPWYNVIGEKSIADAVRDCSVHRAAHVERKGESL